MTRVDAFIDAIKPHASHAEVTVLPHAAAAEDLRGAHSALLEFKRSMSGWTVPLTISEKRSTFERLHEAYKQKAFVCARYLRFVKRLEGVGREVQQDEKTCEKRKVDRAAVDLINKQVPSAVARYMARYLSRFDENLEVATCHSNIGLPAEQEDVDVTQCMLFVDGLAGKTSIALASMLETRQQAFSDERQVCIDNLIRLKSPAGTGFCDPADCVDVILQTLSDISEPVLGLKQLLLSIQIDKWTGSPVAMPLMHAPSFWTALHGTWIVMVLTPALLEKHEVTDVELWLKTCQVADLKAFKLPTAILLKGHSIWVPAGSVPVFVCLSSKRHEEVKPRRMGRAKKSMGNDEYGCAVQTLVFGTQDANMPSKSKVRLLAALTAANEYIPASVKNNPGFKDWVTKIQP